MNPNSNSFCILSHVGVYNDASVHTIIQSLSIHKLHETITWCENNKLDQEFVYLETPYELSCNMLPKHHIDSITSKLPQNVVDYINNNYTDCSDQIEKLKNFIDWHEKITPIKLEEVNSSLKNILQSM